MASDRFTYDLASRRYRDSESGRYLSKATVRNLREAYLDAAKEVAQTLSQRLADGGLTLRQWHKSMIVIVRDTHVGAAALGGGGRNAMTPTNWLAVGRQLKEQYTYLSRFAAEIANGELSGAQVANRAGMYTDAAIQGYERARIARIADIDLPSMPGVDTPCLGRCRCEWSIDETEDEWLATWQTTAGDNCEGCLEREQAWSPLHIPKSTEERVSRNGYHPKVTGDAARSGP